MVDIVIRKAQFNDLDGLNSLVGTHKHELGFIRKVTIISSIDQQEIIVACHEQELAGMVRFHHRLDHQTTLYDIVVSPKYRLQGVGKMLVYSLISEAEKLGKHVILLKCPEDLQANQFYSNIGFRCVDEVLGKHRKLFLWAFSLE